MIESSVVAVLLADSDITDIVGDRITPVAVRQVLSIWPPLPMERLAPGVGPAAVRLVKGLGVPAE